MREVKNILLINEALSHNIGDRAIAGGLAAAIGQVAGGATVVKFWLQRGMLVREHAAATEGRKKTDSGSMRAHPLYHALWSARYLYRLLFSVGRIRRMDLAIFGGGSLIMDNRMQFPTAMYLLGLLLRLFGIPYAVSGVSLSGEIYGPAAALFKRFLAGAAHVDMRDPISRDKARELFGVEVALGSDYAFCLAGLNPTEATPRHDYLVNVTSAVHNRELYLDFLRRFLREFEGRRILLATTGDVGDEQLAAELHAEFQRPGLELLLAGNYQEYCAAVASAGQVVASRLHSGILSVAMCVPTIILDVGYKQKGFFNGIGMERRVVDFNAPISALRAAMEAMPLSERADIAKRQSAICFGNIGKIVGCT